MKRRLDHDTATALAASDAWMRLAAVEALGKLHPAALALHAGDIVNAITDADESVRRAAMRILTEGCIEQAAIAPHAGAIVALLSHPVAMVREAAVKALGNFDQAAPMLHAGAIVSLFEDPDSMVREAAVKALGNFDQAAINHPVAIMQILTDSDPRVRHAARHSAAVTLNYIGRMRLMPTAILLTHMLRYHVSDVRYVAVAAIGNIGDAALESYAGAIAGLIIEPVWDARRKAVQFLALACGAVANILTDTDLDVRDAARGALSKLKRTRARLHWATARAYVHIRLVRPYAICWNEYVGERLCAPGCKWAEADRAAFEAEFIHLIQ
jgi:HEAT repeat protein